jgi:predicted urease superfamily metal-dependent hydrolase
MTYYICYASEDRINAVRLNAELSALGMKSAFYDRGDTVMLTDPMEDIMKSINSSDVLIVLHTELTNSSMLSQIEITHAKNLGIAIYVIKTSRAQISDSIRFELGSSVIISESNMREAAKKLRSEFGRAK